MTRNAVVLLTAILITTSPFATPFYYPPEENTSPGEWFGAFPYQRNAFIGFDTDPAGWTADPTGGAHLDLQPSPDPSNYDLEGTDDPLLYPSDWIEFGEDPAWADKASHLGLPGTRQGIICYNIGGSTPLVVPITWHLDNCDNPNAVKDVWSELIWLQTGTETAFEVVVTTEPGATVVDQ